MADVFVTPPVKDGPKNGVPSKNMLDAMKRRSGKGC